MKLIVIAALSSNRVIGKDGKIPWHISEDFKRYKSLTKGYTVVMGDRTWDSLPLKPQPERENIVLSFNPSFKADGAKVFTSMEEALNFLKDREKIFFIGGAIVYEHAIKIADTLELTRIWRFIEGDTFFPEIDFSEWILISQEDRMHDTFGKYSFMTYKRKK